MKCVNCALVKHSVSEYSTFEVKHVVSYFIPAAFFLFLSLRWSFLMVARWKRFASDHQLELAGLPPTPEVGGLTGCSPLCGQPLPWEGLVKIFLSTSAIGATIVLSFDSINLMIVSLYGFFLISGLIDLLVYFCGYLVLPEGIQSLILSFCFVVEGLTFHSLSSSSNLHLHLLLLAVIVLCSASSILELVYEARLIKYCRCFFTLLQASWLLHIGILSAQDKTVDIQWASIYFTWHLGIAFLLSILVLIFISQRVKSVPTYVIPSLTTSISSSPGGSPSHLMTGQFLQIARRPSSLPMETCKPVFKTTLKTAKSESVRNTGLVDIETWDIL